MKLRYPFIAACIGSACGSAWIAFTKTLAIALGAAGLPGFISVHPSHWLQFGIGLVISMAVAFVLTLVLGKREALKAEGSKETQPMVAHEEENEITERIKGNVSIALPLSGEVKPIEESSDPVFAQKTMGDGILVLPTDGMVYAPEDCRIEFVFPTKHAIGLTTKSGVSLLIHCGIDTVQLEGKGYETFVEQGDVVKKGTLLLKFDIAAIQAAGYAIETPVVVTNLKEGHQLENIVKGSLAYGTEAFTIVG